MFLVRFPIPIRALRRQDTWRHRWGDTRRGIQ